MNLATRGRTGAGGVALRFRAALFLVVPVVMVKRRLLSGWNANPAFTP
jgi:hypothetical protein